MATQRMTNLKVRIRVAVVQKPAIALTMGTSPHSMRPIRARITASSSPPPSESAMHAHAFFPRRFSTRQPMADANVENGQGL
jgi:hypothetical protein